MEWQLQQLVQVPLDLLEHQAQHQEQQHQGFVAVDIVDNIVVVVDNTKPKLHYNLVVLWLDL